MDITEFICEFKEEMLAALLLYALTQLAGSLGDDSPASNPFTASSFTESNNDGTFATIPQGNDIEQRIAKRRKASQSTSRRERLRAYSANYERIFTGGSA